MLSALLGAHGMAATTLLSDGFGTATSTKGFTNDSGVNIGINPPGTNRMGGSISQNLRYFQTATNRNQTNYVIASGRLRVDTENSIGRFTYSPYYETNAFNFGPALGVPNASPTRPVSYDLKVSMQNNATTAARFSFAIGTVETDANNWDFGVQLYHAATADNFYTIQKRFDSASVGVPDINLPMATTGLGTNVGKEVTFLIRVTDAGAETTTYNSRVQVSTDNGVSWIYDSSADTANLPNGFRFDGPGRYISFDQAANVSGNVFYDAVSMVWNSGPRAWDGGGANGNWNTTLNWGGATPVSGSALIFNGTSRQLNTNNISNLAVPSMIFSNGGFEIYGNALTVTNAITNLLGNNTINNSITLGGAARLQSTAGTLTLGGITGSGQNLTVAGAGNVTIGGAIATSSGTLTKQDAGTLTLGGANTYTGATTISAGTLALTGSGAIDNSQSIVISSGATLDTTARLDGSLILNSGQTLSGNGTVNGSLSVSGTLTPGSSVGTLTTGSETWNSGGQLNWEVNAATGTLGVDWDAVAVNGTLDIAASRSTPFVINMSGAASAGFDNTVEHSWDVVTTTGGILNFDPAKITVSAPGFDLGANGGFGVRVSGNNLQVFFGQKPVVAINNAAKSAAFGDLNYSIGGEGTDFSVTGGSTPVLGYQWKKDGANVVNDANISGATTATLTLAKVYGTNAGNYSVVVWNAAGSTTSGDIALSVTKANQHIVATAAPEQDYGSSVTLSSYFVSKDNSDAPTGVALNFSLDSGASIASINNGVLTFNGIGTATVRAAAPATPDYNAGSDVTGDITAGTKTVTITPNDTSRAYGDTNPTFTVTFVGLALGETLATSDITGASSVTASSTADTTTTLGTQTITVDTGSLAGLSSAHYDFTTATGTLTITNRALKIVATPVSKTFGDTDPALTWTTNGFVNGDENLDLGGGLPVLSGSPVLSRDAGESAGAYAISVDASGDTVNTNLSVLKTKNGVLTINNATPIVNVTSLPAETYNGASHPTTGTVTGVGGADLGAATISYTPGGASAPVNAGDYTVQGSFVGNANYNSATGAGSIHIDKATVDPVVTAGTRNYDGTTGATITSRSLTGVYGSDDVTLTGGAAAFDTASVGVGKSVSVSGLSLGGTASGNYQLSSTSAAASANISPATVAPQITADNKSYDGTTSATIATRSLTGVFGSDDVSLTGGTATFDTAAAGAGKTVTATNLSLAGADSGNYELSTTTATTTADITGISVTPQFTADNKTYDGTTAATIASRSLTGVIGTDDVTLTGGTASFASSTAANAITVTATGFTLAGADSGNYQLSSTSANATADITKATVNPIVSVNNKTYDGTTAATIASRSLSGVIGSDDVTLVGGTAVFATASAGTGKSVSVSGLGLAGTDSGNYQLSLTSANTTANINQANPVITWGPLAPIVAGTTLASTLNASADVPGLFAYFEGASPVNNSTLLPIGSHTLTAQFTPTDSVNYSAASLDRSLNVTGEPDTNAPILAVKFPKVKMILSNASPSMMITGVVTEVNLATVKYKWNDGDFTDVANLVYVKAGKPTNWWDTITTGFKPGTNHLVIKAIDLSGNEHKAFDADIYWHVTSPLTIEINGQGTVDNKNKLFDGNGTNLFVGRTYSLSSKIGSGTNYILTNITYTAENPAESGVLFVNSAAAPKSTIAFTMKTNMHIIYNFIENPAYKNGGDYYGLFHEDDGYKHRSAGFAKMKLTSKYKVSGKLSVEGDNVPFTCILNISGSGSATVDRSKWGKNALSLTLTADFAVGDLITGTLSDSSAGWTSQITAYRDTWDKLVNTATVYTNNYTMVVPGFTNAADGPIGYGYGLMSVAIDGMAKAKGATPDGSPLKVIAAKLSKNGHYPFYSVGYKNLNGNFEGELIGWLQFTGVDGHKTPTGDLTWNKTAGWTNYLSGLTNVPVAIEGSCWTNPAVGVRAIELNNGQGTITLGGADVANASTPITLGLDNKFVATPALVKATVSVKDGLWKGSFFVTGDPKPVNYVGAFLQDQNYGRGFFIRPTAGGVIKIDPTPGE